MSETGAIRKGWTYVLQYRRCRGPCATCAKGPGHGPYWYGKRREGKRVVSRYIGKTLKGEYDDGHIDQAV